MIHEALRTRLTSVSAVTALVSTRIYPNVLPQNPTLPALVYQRIDERRETAMGRDPGVVRARMQVSAWATTFTAARAAAEQVRLALERYRGTPTGSGTEVLDAFLEDVRDMDPELVDGILLHRVDVDIEMIYRE